MARRTSRRRTTRKSRLRRSSRGAYYLHYKTPTKIKKVKRLGTSKEKAGQALMAWKRRTRGKGYRIIRAFRCKGGLVKARSLVKNPPRRRTSRRKR